MINWDKQQAIDWALFSIDEIRPEIEQGNFRAIHKRVVYLQQLVRVAAIMEERYDAGVPIIIPPE